MENNENVKDGITGSETEIMKPIVIELPEPDGWDVVTIPRAEYSEMVAESTILHVVERIVGGSCDTYSKLDMLRDVLEIRGDEKDGEKDE